MEDGYEGCAEAEYEDDATIQTVEAAIEMTILIGMRGKCFPGEDGCNEQHQYSESAAAAFEGFYKNEKEEPEDEQQEVHHEDYR